MSTTSYQTNVQTDIHSQSCDPEPGFASFSGRAVSAVEGKGVAVLQLNVEGLTNSKLNIIEQLAYKNKATVILLQETHCPTTEKLVLPDYTLAAYITSKQHGLATFIKQDTEWSLEAQSPPDSEIEWLAVKVQDTTIINVYRPPTVRLTDTSLPSFDAPCLYAGDFSCQHSDWGYSRCTNDGECLNNWASANDLTLLYDPKEPDSFRSPRWNTGSNPDLAFVGIIQGYQQPVRRVLERFPRSQHRP